MSPTTAQSRSNFSNFENTNNFNNQLIKAQCVSPLNTDKSIS